MGSQVSTMGGEERDEDGVRVLSCQKLCEVIQEVYASKSKFDKKCIESRLPRETMEQHLYTFLYQKYGLRSLMVDWASAIIKGVKYYSDVDIVANCFGKILRNELNEDFRYTLTELETTAGDLLVE